MRTADIMHDCVVRLLNHQDEESIEFLCSLLTTMGKVLDLEEAKPQMDQYFNRIEKIVKEGKTLSRITLMLQDIIDLRLHNWVSRGSEQGQNTIDEREEPRKMLSKETERQPDPIEQRDQGVQNEEPWTTVPNRNKRRARDPKNIPKVYTLINPGARQPPTSKIIMRQSVQQDVKLKTSENAQKPDMKTESLPAKPISQETKDLFEKGRCILYRLTPQNFHQVQPEMDEKIQQGPWAQVTLVKGSGGGAKAGDSGLNCFSALQSSPSPQLSTPPQEKADFDGRKGNKNRNRRNRLYNLLHNAPAFSQPDPLTRGTSPQELLESPAPEDEWYWS